MQITINTSDILGDEKTIRDEVIEQISTAFKIEMRKQAEKLVEETLRNALISIIKEKVREIVTMHIDTEFTDVNEFGGVGKPNTTIRNRIAVFLSQQCSFKKTTYQSDQNAFTAAVMETVSKEFKIFQTEYNSMVNKILIQKCMEEAVTKLKAAVGIK